MPVHAKNFNVSAESNGAILLTWTDNNNSASYNIYRSKNQSEVGRFYVNAVSNDGLIQILVKSCIIANTQNMFYQDLPPETGNYYYFLEALDVSGNVLDTDSIIAYYNKPDTQTIYVTNGNSIIVNSDTFVSSDIKNIEVLDTVLDADKITADSIGAKKVKKIHKSKKGVDHQYTIIQK